MIVQVPESPRFPGIHWVIRERVDNDKEHGFYLYLFKTLEPGCDGDIYLAEDVESVDKRMMVEWGVEPEDWVPYDGPDIR
ncbi:MAG TPA: hypothetical protein VMS71_00055 [Candidatus Acidoferrum sp.]|nr:hypothetical protein [Candidatus Acidoferrum sp.]